MISLHFLRPFWFFSYLPLIYCAISLRRQKSVTTAWNTVCDAHLLPYFIEKKGGRQAFLPWWWLMLGTVFVIIALAGPTWSRYPVPTYQKVTPRVVVLDMSEAMLATDLSPDRLHRAKFKLHDMLQSPSGGQWGLVVYTSEPFVVSPLTEDGQTIDALLSSLTPDVMPVAGHALSLALEEAARLITDAGYQRGHILVLTATPPSVDDMAVARSLSRRGLSTSVMAVLGHETTPDASFQKLAHAGAGMAVPFSDTSHDWQQWLRASEGNNQYKADELGDIPIWRDEGRWFLIPALFCFLPLFRRGHES